MIGRDAGVMADLDREAAAGAPPQVAVVAGRLWQGLPGLLGANLIFLAWCAPFGLLSLLGLPILALAVAPLTVGPGLVALVTAAARVVEDVPAGARSTRRPGVRTAFGAGAVLASAFLLAWHAQLIALRAVVSHGATPATIVCGEPSSPCWCWDCWSASTPWRWSGSTDRGSSRQRAMDSLLAVRHPDRPWRCSD